MHKKVRVKALVLVTLGLCVLMSVCTGISSATSVEDSHQITSNLTTAHRVIMCTGFWNPTGLMLVPFSTDPELNPEGWQGENWEGLGYDIYSYFPKPGEYTGMFEVDYQHTWDDFWNVTALIHPFAIISFGAGVGPWEIEYNARNLGAWIPDNEPPYQPTPCPPDESKPVDYVRHATLPVQQIADAVHAQTTLDAWVDWSGNPGAYLCEYIAYLAMWYQDMHNTTNDAAPCRTAGFIHVNAGVPVELAMEATKITIRETIQYLSTINLPPGTPTITGQENGTIKQTYNYNCSTLDPDRDDVLYYIDWGDGTNSGWIGSYSSGEVITVSHVWNKKGTYTVKVKAKDVLGAESGWGTLKVTMPVSSMKPMPGFLEMFFERFPNAFPLIRHLVGF
jgi:pyrrolidone-carboxylate peptidase